MAFDRDHFSNWLENWWSQVPHPQEPRLTIGEMPSAVKMATQAKFNGHASFAEAASFMDEFKSMNASLQAKGKPPLSPQDFSHALDRLAPLSFAYHGRPPSMKEIENLHDQPPATASKYFGDLPDRNHPTVSSAQMISALQAAKPHAQQHLNRDPNKTEAAYLIHSGDSPAQYYRYLGEDLKAKGGSGGDQAQAGGGSQAGGYATSGGRQAYA